MRLLRRGVGLGMARPHRDPSETQTAHQLANAALVQLYHELAGDPLAQVDQSPTHDAILIGIRSATHPLGDFRLLLRRQFRFRATAMRAVGQADDTLGIEAVHPIAQGLAIHAALPGGVAAPMPVQHQRDRQHPPRRRRIAGSPGFPP
jgi:hypothetical protein